ncbi:hypothetical protein E3H11_02145 [Bradyrhizobium brasilense]|nr:hypothetical protein [Bradyrhizobium brasilense]
MTREQDVSAECAREARKQAALLPPGPVRDALLEKARQYELLLQVHNVAPRPSRARHIKAMPSQSAARERLRIARSIASNTTTSTNFLASSIPAALDRPAARPRRSTRHALGSRRHGASCWRP